MSNTLVSFSDGLHQMCRGKTSYYLAINPESPYYDKNMPIAIQVGVHPNSPRAFVQDEIDAYVAAVIDRHRKNEATRGNSKTSRAHLMLDARRSIREKKNKSGVQSPDCPSE